MPFQELVSPTIAYQGMHLNDTWEQMAELVPGVHGVGAAGLLSYAQPEGYYEGDAWHWRFRFKNAKEGISEELAMPGDWIIIGKLGDTVVTIDKMTDEERIAAGLQVAE